MTRLSCPTCGIAYRIPDKLSGSVISCGKCEEKIRVPDRRPDTSIEPASAKSQKRRHDTEAVSSETAGTLILCYACKRKVANNAENCPKCGAKQTEAGRDKGRKLKKQLDKITAVVVAAIAIPAFLMCVFTCGMPSNNSPPEPPRLNVNQLKEDVKYMVRDPNRQMFIPANGGQPIVVEP
jgi:DNA-directed RNA polymerase subunit M/transcription elongation factor TFIIS